MNLATIQLLRNSLSEQWNKTLTTKQVSYVINQSFMTRNIACTSAYVEEKVNGKVVSLFENHRNFYVAKWPQNGLYSRLSLTFSALKVSLHWNDKNISNIQHDLNRNFSKTFLIKCKIFHFCAFVIQSVSKREAPKKNSKLNYFQHAILFYCVCWKCFSFHIVGAFKIFHEKHSWTRARLESYGNVYHLHMIFITRFPAFNMHIVYARSWNKLTTDFYINWNDSKLVLSFSSETISCANNCNCSIVLNTIKYVTIKGSREVVQCAYNGFEE